LITQFGLVLFEQHVLFLVAGFQRFDLLIFLAELALQVTDFLAAPVGTPAKCQSAG
jgi:hypothetical protein